MRVSFYTLGCKLNQSETEALAFAFKAKGLEIVDHSEKVDLSVINTCTVTSKSEQKARRMIRQISGDNPDALVVITGCYAQTNAEDLRSLFPHCLVVPQDQKEKLLFLIEYLGSSSFEELPLKEKIGFLHHRLNEQDFRDPFAFHLDHYQFHARAFLKIQEGCNNFCAYCRVPLARGPSLSLEADEVLKRAVLLESQGYEELVITGVNISDYHFKNHDFSWLVGEILKSTRKIRVRLSSLEPDRVLPAWVDLFAHQRICPHFHVPVQSGSDVVLQKMKRKYRADQVTRVVEMFRSVKNNPFLGADIILGFPGESDADFEASYRILEENRFSSLHCFPFSPRPGTAAFNYKPVIDSRIKTARVHKVLDLSKKLFSQYQQQWIGKELDIILENQNGQGLWNGLSDNYLRVFLQQAPEGPKKGMLVKTRLLEIDAQGQILGRLV
ncbi:MAG: tRNA (N(6)-L-threonylcarbamoyladenosine(37)-C(2))-methylthiotransferase MtaB [Spirochaetales bacterium]|nr:tRNA (N(6)-L-threonylcarbamoyladenosine(37)-C(2))-methylthiotransferase MtaB [Spirochaetales bacterium]